MDSYNEGKAAQAFVCLLSTPAGGRGINLVSAGASSPHPTPHTLHPAPYTLLPTPCTLHPTLHTPHPTSSLLVPPTHRKHAAFVALCGEDCCDTTPPCRVVATEIRRVFVRSGGARGREGDAIQRSCERCAHTTAKPCPASSCGQLGFRANRAPISMESKITDRIR